MNVKKLICIVVILALHVLEGYARQPIELKTNLAYWATATPNMAAEFSLNPKHSLQIEAGYNPWKFSNHKQWKHWVGQAELKHWFCETFNGHFIGIHVLGGQYNAGFVDLPLGLFPSLADNRYQGWGVGGGISYGYQWLLSKHWNFELSAGVGYIYLKYKKYGCAKCGGPLKKDHTNYLGPTKLSASLIYVF